MSATVDDVREIALSLPRAYEVLVRDRVKFRVGQIVFAALSRDETTVGFGYPRDERTALVESEPTKFHLPSRASDLRYQWVEANLQALEVDELRELIVDAWRMCVPKGVAAAFDEASWSPPRRNVSVGIGDATGPREGQKPTSL